MLKKYTLGAELAGHAPKLDVKLRSLCDIGFSVCCVHACQAVPFSSELTNNIL